jgi:hypothetical protein
MLDAVAAERIEAREMSADKLRLNIDALELIRDNMVGQIASHNANKPKSDDFLAWKEHKKKAGEFEMMLVINEFESACYEFHLDPTAYTRFLEIVEPAISDRVMDFFKTFGKEHLGIEEEVG